MNKKQSLIKRGLLNELIFIEKLKNYFNDDIEFKKTSQFFSVDFEILNDNTTIGWVELKTRRYENDINLYLAWSKLEYIYQFGMKNTFLIWFHENKNLYYVIHLDFDTLISIKDGTTTFLSNNQKTIDIDKKYSVCYDNIAEVAEYIKLKIYIN